MNIRYLFASFEGPDQSEALLGGHDFNDRAHRANKTEGGKYSLSEILIEKKRRRPSAFGVA